MKSCMCGLAVSGKQKAPRRNRRGAKSKNEFELAGYLAFFILVASDPKSIQRTVNVGRGSGFVKPHMSSRGRRVSGPYRPNILRNFSQAPSTSFRLRSTSLAHLRNCSNVIADDSSKLPRLKKKLRMK